MISLFYRAWEKYRFPIAYERGDFDQVGSRLLDFIGLGTPGLQDRQAIPDDALIYYSGLLSQQPRCAANLEKSAGRLFRCARVEVEQFVGAWYKLDQSPTQFSMRDQNDVSEQLGFGAVVGDEVWIRRGSARIRLGPAANRAVSRYFCRVEPRMVRCARSRSFTRAAKIDFEVQLILDRRDVPPCEIGSEGGTAPRLGWLTWARSQPMGRDPGETILPL